MNTLTSQLLIASPELENDFFAQSVIFVLDHSASNGAAGIVLNKPSGVALEDVMLEFSEPELEHVNELVNIGGPCEGPIVALHSGTEYSEVKLLPGVAMVVKPNNLKRLIQSKSSVRLYSGYAGWAPGQLEMEIESGGWFSTEATSSLIFGEPTELWRQACEQYGNGIISNVVGGRVLSDPMTN